MESHSGPIIRETGTTTRMRPGVVRWVVSALWTGTVCFCTASAQPERQSKPGAAITLGEGRFAQALDARSGGVEVVRHPRYDKPPFSVECLAKLFSNGSVNLLVGQNPKTSSNHWEIYSAAQSGCFSALLPGYEPSEFVSRTVITDGRWHHLLMSFDGTTVTLYVDAEKVLVTKVRRVREGGPTGPLRIGAIPPASGCDGLIDEVRLTRDVVVPAGFPETPLPSELATLGLWRFDRLHNGQRIEDVSLLKSFAGAIGSANMDTTKAKVTGHWGEDNVGVRWTESDSVDGRWQETDTGPFFSASFDTPQNPTAKAIAVKVGAGGLGGVLFDTKQLGFRLNWSGQFIQIDPQRYGLIRNPKIAGDLRFDSGPVLGWHGESRYGGLYLQKQRVTFAYRVNDAEVFDSPWLHNQQQTHYFTRSLRVGPCDEILKTALSEQVGTSATSTKGSLSLLVDQTEDLKRSYAVAGNASLTAEEGKIILALPPSSVDRDVVLVLWNGTGSTETVQGIVDQTGPARDLLEPGSRLWTADLRTKGMVSEEEGPLVVDTVRFPFQNPYKALFFAGGHDFFSDGRAAICTVHGDVWIVDGLDKSLREVSWTRYATGLYHPLGLRIVDNKVYVLGRDQITRLHDRNNDGEADYYENFNNDGETSASPHDYATCLETDSSGAFYYLRAKRGVLRVSRDGMRHELFAEGFRNPNGMGIGYNDVITVSPQEGEWTPNSNITEVRPGGYYGYGGPRVNPGRPLGYDPPLCWIPRLKDNSSGGQVWIPENSWGPLGGQLLHFSYGRCWMMLTLREQIGKVSQGGTVRIPIQFESGVMRGRFNPKDGHLYVTGLRGWVSAAVRDGCFQRVRYTGQNVHLPVALNVHRNGILVRFAAALDRVYAEDPGNYSVKQWNYRWAADYGSPEYRVSKPTEQGRDQVEVVSASLQPDGRSVFLELGRLRPVMQMEIAYTLKTRSGTAFRDTIHNTINLVPNKRIEPTSKATSSSLLTVEQRNRLRPGLIWRFRQTRNGKTIRDARIGRLAALTSRVKDSPSSFLRAGRFRATGVGFFKIPLRSTLRFHWQGSGNLSVTVNGRQFQAGVDEPFEMEARGGYNRVRLDYQSPEQGDSVCRLYWASSDFSAEPLPPEALFHDPADQLLQAKSRLREARDLYCRLQCHNCHQSAPSHDSAMPELSRAGPSLRDTVSSLSPNWIIRWIEEPASLRNDVTMPKLVEQEDPGTSSDIAAYLKSLTGASPPVARESSVKEGERLFEELGCIACHHFEPPSTDDPFERISLHFVSAKFLKGGLARFLDEPHANYPWNRMPSFQLSRNEAGSLAKYLRSRATGTLTSVPLGDFRKGKNAFLRLGCNQCHHVDSEHGNRAVAIRSVRQGCLAVPSGERPVPQYSLSPAQRELLSDLLGTEDPWTTSSAAETSVRLKAYYRCNSCHDSDGRPAPWAQIVLEEGYLGRNPERIPSMTWLGEKLNPGWTERFLAGRAGYKPRPWLRGRMPRFAVASKWLAEGLSQEHGFKAGPHPALDLKSDRTEDGYRLTLKDQGLDCRQCHALDQRVLKLEGNSQGVSLPNITGRIRRAYYDRWMLNPLRIDPATKMPKFSADGVSTEAKSILGGEARGQFEALWHYLDSLGRKKGR